MMTAADVSAPPRLESGVGRFACGASRIGLHHRGGIDPHSLPPLWVMLVTVVVLVVLGLVAARLKVRAVEVVRG